MRTATWTSTRKRVFGVSLVASLIVFGVCGSDDDAGSTADSVTDSPANTVAAPDTANRRVFRG